MRWYGLDKRWNFYRRGKKPEESARRRRRLVKKQRRQSLEERRAPNYRAWNGDDHRSLTKSKRITSENVV